MKRLHCQVLQTVAHRHPRNTSKYRAVGVRLVWTTLKQKPKSHSAVAVKCLHWRDETICLLPVAATLSSARLSFLLVFYRPSVAAAINYNVSSDGACDRQTDGWTDSSPHCCVRAGASNPPTMGGRSTPHIRHSEAHFIFLGPNMKAWSYTFWPCVWFGYPNAVVRISTIYRELVT